MQIVIYVYPGLTLLDAVGPYEVLRNLEGVGLKLVAKEIGELATDSQLVHLNIKHSIAEIDSADVLIVPGSAISFLREAKDAEVLNWIRKIHATAQKTTSVCSGSIILAAAGLLNGLPATSHWKVVPLLEKHGAIPTRKRIVDTGKVVTAAGVSAGIDMALHLARELKGDAEAKAVQLFIEYDPAPPLDAGNFDRADAETIQLAEAKLVADAKKDLSLWEMLRHAGDLLKLKNS